MNRRNFILSAAAFLCAPAILRVSLAMPISPLPVDDGWGDAMISDSPDEIDAIPGLTREQRQLLREVRDRLATPGYATRYPV